MKAQDILPVRQLVESRLMEARGIGGRSPGDEFVAVADPDQKIYMDTVAFYPLGGGAYESQEDLHKDLDKIIKGFKKSGVSVHQISDFKQNQLGFGVATFNTPTGMKLAYIKPMQTVHADPAQNKTWKNQDGIPGYRYNSNAARKSQAGMSPQDVLTGETNGLKPKDIVLQISNHFGADSPLTLLAANLARGMKLPMEISPEPGMSFSAFRDYFCELLHPIALHKGTYTGNAGKAAARFFGGGDFSRTTINFGKDKTESLSDSIMIDADGRSIKVSSKGGKGAEASVTSLLKAADDIKLNLPKLYKTYRKTIDLIEEIKSAGQYESPLMLGVEYNIISARDADAVRNMRGQPVMPMAGLESLLISAKFKKMLKARTPKNTDRVNMYFHMLAVVAETVAEHVNTKTDFSEQAAAILNNGAMVQVYTIATEQKDRWKLTEFKTRWPGDEVSGVKFSSGKNYFSTDIKGNFTFKILGKGTEDIEDAPATTPVKTPAAMKTRAAPKPVSPTATKAKVKAAPNTPALGRKKTK